MKKEAMTLQEIAEAKKKMTLEEVAYAMIDCNDHSAISEDLSTVWYVLPAYDDDGDECGEHTVRAEMDPKLRAIAWDSDEDESIHDGIDEFLDRFDSEYETLENPYFRAAAEEMMDLING